MEVNAEASTSKASPGMLSVHRVRFVDYDPSPIAALAFTPLPLPPADPRAALAQAQSFRADERAEFGSLVCARQNGQVDIWEWVDSKQPAVTGGWALQRVRMSPPALKASRANVARRCFLLSSHIPQSP